MINQGAVTVPAPQPDADTENIEVKPSDVMSTKTEASSQTSGGSMMGMPTSAIQNAKTAGAAVPTAKQVATENKVYNQVDETRAPLYKTPVNTSEMFSKKPYVEVPETQQLEKRDLGEFTDLGNQLSDEDAGDFAGAQATIKSVVEDGSEEDKKELTDNYFNKADEELKKKADSKWPLWATIASIALFAISDGAVPPINFVALTGQKDAKDKWNTLLQEKSEWESKAPSEMRGEVTAGEVAAESPEQIKSATEAQTEIAAAQQGKGSELGQKEMENAYNILEKQLKLTHDQAVEFMRAQSQENTKSQIDILEKMKNNTIAINDAATQNQAGLLADTAKQWGIPLTKDGLVALQRAMLGESTFSKYSGQATQLAAAALQLLK